MSSRIRFRFLNPPHCHWFRIGPLGRKAAPPGAGHLPCNAAQFVWSAVEAGVAVDRVGGVEADGRSLVIVVLVHCPRGAPGHYDGAEMVIYFKDNLRLCD